MDLKNKPLLIFTGIIFFIFLSVFSHFLIGFIFNPSLKCDMIVVSGSCESITQMLLNKFFLGLFISFSFLFIPSIIALLISGFASYFTMKKIYSNPEFYKKIKLSKKHYWITGIILILLIGFTFRLMLYFQIIGNETPIETNNYTDCLKIGYLNRPQCEPARNTCLEEYARTNKNPTPCSLMITLPFCNQGNTQKTCYRAFYGDVSDGHVGDGITNKTWCNLKGINKNACTDSYLTNEITETKNESLCNQLKIESKETCKAYVNYLITGQK